MLWPALGLALLGAAAPRLVWDAGSLTLVVRGGVYGRMVRLPDNRLLCACERAGRVVVTDSRDDGRTWPEPRVVITYPPGVATNAELLVLDDGSVLLSYNERPRDGVHPFTIRCTRSTDGGATWAPSVLVYAADTQPRNGCWEPCAVQQPTGEVRLLFANENPYRGSDEQELSVTSSTDRGATWSAARRFCFRPGHRDGMPVPLLLDGVLTVALEDNGLAGNFKPVIVRELPDGSLERRAALEQPLAPEVYAGAPYLARLADGTTLLSCQSDEGGRRRPQMVVYVGEPAARGFGSASVPFALPGDVAGQWNSLCAKDARTVTALSTTTQRGVRGLWAVDGRLER